MREGWVETTLGGTAYVNPKEPPIGSDVPFITMQDVQTWGTWASSSGPRGTRGGIRARGGDILVARITPCLENGKIAMVPTQIDRTGGSTEFIVVRAREHVLDKFVFLAVTHQPTHQRAIALMTGTTGRQRVSGSDLAELSINLPPLPEQHRIVDLMGAVDAYVAAADARVEMARVARTALLGDLLSNPGEDWVETTLGLLGRWKSGATPKASNAKFYGGDIPFVTIADLNDGRIHETDKYLTEKGLAEIGHTAPTGAIFVSMYGTVGRIGIAQRPMTTNQAIAWLEAESDAADAQFLFWWLFWHAGTFDQQARGATQRTINREIIKETPISLPPLPEQHRIVDLMSAAATEVAAAATTAAAARTLRTALLSDLLSGNHEIPASYDRFVEAA